MQRNPLIIAYHSALLLYASIEEISTFVICLSIMMELVMYTVIVAVFSLKSYQGFIDALMFISLSAVMISVQYIVFYLISVYTEEDPVDILNKTLIPLGIGLIATYSITSYRIVQEKIPIEELRAKLGDQYTVLYGFGYAAPVSIAIFQTAPIFIVMGALVLVRILVEYDFFRKKKPEQEIQPGIRGFIQLSPSQQAHRLLRKIRREKRRKNSH